MCGVMSILLKVWFGQALPFTNSLLHPGSWELWLLSTDASWNIVSGMMHMGVSSAW